MYVIMKSIWNSILIKNEENYDGDKVLEWEANGFRIFLFIYCCIQANSEAILFFIMLK